MAYSATVYQVLVSSPSDVEEERHAIADVVQLWNSTNSRNSKIVFLPAMWETDATPQLGDRPQALLNRQLVEPSDILIAVFWTRIGSHTGVSESGTIEEIEEFKKMGKRVLIYFSEKPIPTDADVDQFKMVKAFRERIIKEKWGLFYPFSNIPDLKSNLDRHLTKISGELIVQRPSDESRVAKEVEIKDKVTSIKEELLLKQRTFRAEWEAERDSEPLNINVGKNILMRFGAELHEFRPSLDGIVDDQSLSRMDKIFRMTKSIQKYLVHADGGLSFKKFWQEGNNIFEQAKFAIDGISSLEKVS